LVGAELNSEIEAHAKGEGRTDSAAQRRR
jgi:hypothetical protein